MRNLLFAILIILIGCIKKHPDKKGNIPEIKYLEAFVSDSTVIDCNRFNLIFNSLVIYPIINKKDTNLLFINQDQNDYACLFVDDTVFIYRDVYYAESYERLEWVKWSTKITFMLDSNKLNERSNIIINPSFKNKYYLFSIANRRILQVIWLKLDRREILYKICTRNELTYNGGRLLLVDTIRNDFIKLKNKKIIDKEGNFYYQL